MQAVSDRTYYLMALTRIPQLGGVRIKKLLQHYREPAEIFRAPFGELRSVAGESLAAKIRDFDQWHLIDEEIAFTQRHGIKILTFLDEDYPLRLLHIPDLPTILFQKGNLNLRDGRYLSVVGTRKITPYGRQATALLVEKLAPYRPVIVSGMAFGVDIEAHKAALHHNLPTVAVMGTSFLHIYPDSHREYASRITENGALLTEFWSYEKTDKNFFVRRNRIVAGMSAATVIVESGIKGGAMLTARMAFDYNREVFAVPGRITDTYSQGCLKLIRENVAQILTSPQDIVKTLHWDEQVRPSRPVQKKIFTELNEPQQKIYDYLADGKTEHLDIIALETALPVSEASRHLMMMELNGLVQSLPGKKFKLA